MTPIAGIEFECSPMFRAAGRVTEIKHLDGEDKVTVTFLVPSAFNGTVTLAGSPRNQFRAQNRTDSGWAVLWKSMDSPSPKISAF